MLSLIESVSSSSNLFSTISSCYHTSQHNTARFVLMKCVGECLRIWPFSFVDQKKDEVIQLVLAGVKDRAGEVRDASRIVFCILYCRCYSSLSNLPSSEELSSEECRYGLSFSFVVDLCLSSLLSKVQQSNLSGPAFDLIKNELASYHRVSFIYPFLIRDSLSILRS